MLATMALIPCQECNKRISDRAVSCPHCGCPNEPGARPGQSLADQQRLRVLGQDPNSGLPDAETLREIQRKRKFWAMLRAQYWNVFGTLISFIAFAIAIIAPVSIAISTSSANPLLLLLLPVVSLVGAGALFNIRANASGFLLGVFTLICLCVGALIIHLGFAKAGGIDTNGSYSFVGWLIVFAYWVVNQKAPSAMRKAAALAGPD